MLHEVKTNPAKPSLLSFANLLTLNAARRSVPETNVIFYRESDGSVHGEKLI